MIIPVFGAGNFHRDGDEFSSRGNFIYITMEINPDRGGKRMYVMRRMLKGVCDTPLRICRRIIVGANRIRPIYIGISVYNGCRA